MLATTNGTGIRLELDHLTLAFLVATQFEMLATLQWSLLAVLALSTFHTKHDFLCCLCLRGKRKTGEKRIEINRGVAMVGGGMRWKFTFFLKMGLV